MEALHLYFRTVALIVAAKLACTLCVGRGVCELCSFFFILCFCVEASVLPSVESYRFCASVMKRYCYEERLEQRLGRFVVHERHIGLVVCTA